MEVNCETDFVAKNDDFVDFSNSVAAELLGNPSADLEEKRTAQIAKIGENIQISRSESLAPEGSGIVQSYIHTGGKVAVLISIGAEGDVSGQENALVMAKDLCMHIAAASPICVSRDEVPSELVEKETEIARHKPKESLHKRLRKL